MAAPMPDQTAAPDMFGQAARPGISRLYLSHGLDARADKPYIFGQL
jgi:hypothetical protein